MKMFAAITKLLSLAFKKDSQDITFRPNQATTYSAARDIQLPAGDADHVLVSAAGSAALTNKTIDADLNTLSNIENADIKAAAGIVYSKLSIADGDLTIAKTSGLQTALDGKLSDAGDTITGALTFDNNVAAVFKEATGNGSSAVTLKGPAALAGNLDFILPATAGSSGNVLSTDGAGATSWIAAASVASFASNWVTADGASLAITHSLNSKDVIVQIYDKTDDSTIEVTSATRTDVDTVTVTASEAPGAAGWRVLILKI
jgi:hypothetical protein